MKTLATSLLRALISLFLLLPFTDAFALIDQVAAHRGHCRRKLLADALHVAAGERPMERRERDVR